MTGALIAIFGTIFALVGAALFGRRSATKNAENKTLRSEAETRKRMDNAKIHDPSIADIDRELQRLRDKHKRRVR